MGKGKGRIKYHICKIQPGKILIELGHNISKNYAIKALKYIALKLPIKTKIIYLKKIL